MLVSFSIDDPNFAVILSSFFPVIADVQQPFSWIIGYPVGARLEPDGIEKFQGICLKYPQHSIIPACDEQLVESSHVSDALWFLEPRNTFQPLTRFQVHYFHGAIFQASH